MKFFGILCAVKAHAIATTFTFGGNPVVSSKGTSYFNDMPGTTLGAKAKGKKYSAAALTKMRGQIPRNPFFKGPAGSVPLRSSDEFKDPIDVFNVIPWDLEAPYGRPYGYGHAWSSQILNGEGYIWARMI